MAKNNEGEVQQGGFFGRIFGNKVCDKTEASNTAQCPIQYIPPRVFTLTVMTPENTFDSFVRVLENSNYLSLSITG
jgi:hypothetical protein